MAERKNTNPFAEEESNVHLPPNVYQPQPYPINPEVGNPWAVSKDYQQNPQQQGHVDNNSSSTYSYGQGHTYNTSSDSGSNYPPYIPMPTPSVNSYNTNSSSYNNYDPNAYSNNAYNNTPYNNANTNAYEHSNDSSRDENVKGETDNNTTDVNEASVVNPGIETHDPDKLKISSQMVTSIGAPNKWRLLTRFIQFLASVGAFAFIVLTSKPISKRDPPVGANKTAIIFLYIVSAVSIIYSFGHIIFYCVRRWGKKNKAPRWSLLLIDSIIGASFGTLMVFLIKDYRCKVGDLNGWCDLYNTSIFFTVLAFVTYAVSFIWDIVGGFKRS